MSNSLRPHVLQHPRLLCPFLPPRVWSSSCPLRWCFYLTVSSSVTSFCLCLPSFPVSEDALFYKELALCIRWSKYWSFSFSIHPSNEYSELISFRIDWLDLLAVQGTLKSLLQNHSWKASIIRRSAFCMVQLSYMPMTTGKTIPLTIQTLCTSTYMSQRNEQTSLEQSWPQKSAGAFPNTY